MINILMAEHFKFYPSDEEVVTPWNARYSYPSQANKATKMTPRMPPKNGMAFSPGQPIRLEFPAQGYVNPLNTLIEFDVVMFAPIVSSGAWAVRFQNNIQSIFSRVRLLYGSSPQEDIQQYGLLVRCLTEWTSTNQMNNLDQGTIADGIGGSATGTIMNQYWSGQLTGVSYTSSDGSVVTFAAATATGGVPPQIGSYVNISGVVSSGGYNLNGNFLITNSTGTFITVSNPGVPSGLTVTGTIVILPCVAGDGFVNTRQAYIQGLEQGFAGSSFGAPNADWEETTGIGCGFVPNSGQAVGGLLPSGVNAPSAAFNQATGAGVYSVRRYMVNLALGIFTQDKLIPTKYMASQLAIELTLENANACMYMPVGYANLTTAPTYAVGNINLIAEIIEFDDTYDQQFLQGLETGGVPLKFSSWHYFSFSTSGASSLQLQITERSRSVKGIFAVQRRGQPGFQYDSHACLFDSNSAVNQTTQGSTLQSYQFRIGGRFFPGAPVQLSQNVGGSIPNSGAEGYIELAKFLNIVGDARLKTNINTLNWAVPAIVSLPQQLLPEHDYSYSLVSYNAYGVPNVVPIETSYSAFCGNMPSCMFACAINFETSNGVEISGLNAEEQSDISFNVMWSGSQTLGFDIECFTYVDLIWLLRPNNYLDLIQ